MEMYISIVVVDANYSPCLVGLLHHMSAQLYYSLGYMPMHIHHHYFVPGSVLSSVASNKDGLSEMIIENKLYPFGM